MAAEPVISRTNVTPVGRRKRLLVPFFFLLLSAATAHGGTHSPQYLRLQAALDLYLQTAVDGGWPTVPDGETLAPGDRDPRIAALTRRLQATGDLERDGREFETYDDRLAAAVLRFQKRHGLGQDALVGPATLRAMNVPVEQRIAQLRLNLDRTARVFDSSPPNFVLVNVPAFTTYLYRDRRLAWTGRIIVGETEAETPLFESEIMSVVLNPSWAVPRSIASEELLPKIQQDPAFLSRGGFDVLDPAGAPIDASQIDWASLHRDNFPYTLVQRPGPVNELGRVKFMIPNPYDVCMHDTPGKYLFALDSRAFSHGCIRLDRPLDFAAEVLAAENWSREQIDARLATQRTETIPLQSPLPLIVTYLTASVDGNGTVYFYRDIYGMDEIPPQPASR
jgi:murein L,D-transpeptidase YcbB/YkuD